MTGSRAASCSTTRTQPLEDRNRIAMAMFRAWWHPVQPVRRHPRRSASRQLHGVRARAAQPAGINLLDYGCIRIFPPRFVRGVVDLYRGPAARTTRDRVVHAYETWGFKGLSRRADRHPQHLGALHLRAAAGRPRAHDRRRRRRPANTAAARPSRCTRRCKEKGPVTVPREFVFMDRAAIGLGAVFLHLDARAELPPPVQRGDRRASTSTPLGEPPGRGARARRPAAARLTGALPDRGVARIAGSRPFALACPTRSAVGGRRDARLN